MKRLNDLNIYLKRALTNSFKTQKQKLEVLRSKIGSPLVILREQNQRIDSYELQLKQNIKISFNQNKQKLNLLNIRFKEKSPSAYIQELNIKLGNIKNMIQKEIKSCLNRNLIFIQEYEKNLEILNPFSILLKPVASFVHKKQLFLWESSLNDVMGSIRFIQFVQMTINLRSN